MGDLFSGPHVILILLIVVLMFGGKKIPELMKGLGNGIREFKDAKDNVKKDIEDHINQQSEVGANIPSSTIVTSNAHISSNSTNL